MAIKNYTSEVSAYKSLGEIQESLARHGARKIMTEYGDDNWPVGIAFAVETPLGLRGFSLPANMDGVKAVMIRQKVKVSDEQVERTAWRNIRDWVLAQMAIVEAGMVQLDEVFLPYMTDKSGNTVYQLYQGGCLMLEGGTP